MLAGFRIRLACAFAMLAPLGLHVQQATANEFVCRPSTLSRDAADLAASWSKSRAPLRILAIGSSSTVRRDRHFLTVFSLIPKRCASFAAEACDRCSSARTACVVLALP